MKLGSGERDAVLGVIQIKAGYAGVVRCTCGQQMRAAARTTTAGAPNTPMQPTASRERSLVF